MFGINSFEQIGDIIEGHYNELMGKEQKLSKQRMAICKKCPLFSEESGGICDSKKCWDTKNNSLTMGPGKGIVCGCNCRLKAKTALLRAKCVLHKW